MDLIPKPDQVVSAAANVAHRLAYGGLADLRPMPRTLIADGTLREVYHYRPAEPAGDQGDPVLLVTPLAAPALCYDLRRGCSLVEHLVETGRPTYLVEYGEVSFRDRDLGIGPWVDEIVPTAVREVSTHAGGRPVHLVGWSLGGTFALLAAAGDTTLPIASITALGSPFDVHDVPLVAPLRPLLDLADGQGPIPRIVRASGVARQPLVRWTLELSLFQRWVAKPVAMACHLDDAGHLAQLEAVDRFTAQTTAYRGRTFGQLYHRLLTGDALIEGRWELADRTVSLADVTAPVLVFGGATDTIAPIASVKAVTPLLADSPDVRFEIVPGGHLGMLTGRQARTGTWPLIDAWVDEWSRAEASPAPAAPAASRRTPRKARPKRTPAKKSASPEDAAEPTIGANPTRRYGSAGSRALRR